MVYTNKETCEEYKCSAHAYSTGRSDGSDSVIVFARQKDKANITGVPLLRYFASRPT